MGALPQQPAFDRRRALVQSGPVKLLLLLPLWFFAGCAMTGPDPGQALVPGDPSAPSQVTPAEALANARRLATHEWQPYASNIMHGKDRKGVPVNTPDISHDPQGARRGWWVPGAVNRGIPYKWGGYDDPASFDAAVAGGRAAGDVSTPTKRRADNAGVSAQAAGLDCSGFVSRCLGLPAVHDTSRLPELCEELPDAADLAPGDLLNIPHRHVMLCAGWADPAHSWVYYYETGGGPDYWRPGLKQAPLGKLLALGYKPLRYRGMARAHLPPGTAAKEVLTRAVKATAVSVPDPTIGEP
jgi:hypothetical protein